MEAKRVYVGGLYHEATEKDLKQLFTKFGDVESVEIKKRSENNMVNFVFAYVNVKTTGDQIEQCFRRLNGTFWKGKRLKLELAKESFLAKLQRERQQSSRPAAPPPRRRTMQDRILEEVLSAAGQPAAAPDRVLDFTEQPAADGPRQSPPPQRPSNMNRSREAAEDAASAEESPPSRGALRMFGGIGGTSSERGAASPAPAPAAGDCDLLSRLEAFSSVWGDDGHTAAVPGRRGRAASAAAQHNQKRMASLRQKQQAFQSQRRALKLALSSKTDAPRPNKRIVFDPSDEDDDVTDGEAAARSAPERRHVLFGEEEAEEEEADDFRIRPQYEGEQGQKLQSLQARFGADERFTLDERFAEGAAADSEQAEQQGDAVREEHRRQMDILSGVLGTGKPAKRASGGGGPVRFDPSLEAHCRYQLNTDRPRPQPPAGEQPPAAARQPAPVRPDTFYQVTPQLGTLFSGDRQPVAGFSLLSMLGRDTEHDDKGEEEEYKTTEIKTKKKQPAVEGAAANPFQYDSSSSEDEAEDGSTLPSLGVAAGGDWTQARKFFLQPNDPRLNGGKPSKVVAPHLKTWGRLLEALLTRLTLASVSRMPDPPPVHILACRGGVEWVSSAPSAEQLRQQAEQRRPELRELIRTQRHSRRRQQRQRGRRLRPG